MLDRVHEQVYILLDDLRALAACLHALAALPQPLLLALPRVKFAPPRRQRVPPKCVLPDALKLVRLEPDAPHYQTALRVHLVLLVNQLLKFRTLLHLEKLLKQLLKLPRRLRLNLWRVLQ